MFGYELLFRSGPENFFPPVDANEASTQVVHDALNVFGLQSLAANRRLFINTSRGVLLRGILGLLPVDVATIELLETIEPDDEVVAACRALKKAGFLLALDDFVFRPEFAPLLDLADIVKVDFLVTRDAARGEMMRLLPRRIRLLAEKVETQEDLAEATALGYALFQGYFFCRPQMISTQDIPAFKLNHVRLLQAVGDPLFDLDRIEGIVKQEMALTVKLLRYLNSAGFGLRRQVTSIRHAVLLLGEDPFRKWCSLVAVAGMGADRPAELVVTCLVRARFAELLGIEGGLVQHQLALFLVGLLSSVDALIGRPIEELLDRIAVSSEVREAILHDRGDLGKVHTLTLAYERGEWSRVAEAARLLSVEETRIPDLYSDALAWGEQVFRV